MYYYVLLCIIMYYYVLLCIIMYYYVLLCIITYYYVSLCIIMYYYVLLCIIMYNYVLFYIIMYYYVLLCIIMYYYVLCTDLITLHCILYITYNLTFLPGIIDTNKHLIAGGIVQTLRRGNLFKYQTRLFDNGKLLMLSVCIESDTRG